MGDQARLAILFAGIVATVAFGNIGAAEVAGFDGAEIDAANTSTGPSMVSRDRMVPRIVLADGANEEDDFFGPAEPSPWDWGDVPDPWASDPFVDPWKRTPEDIADKAEELTNRATYYIQEGRQALKNCDYAKYQASRARLEQLQSIARGVQELAGVLWSSAQQRYEIYGRPDDGPLAKRHRTAFDAATRAYNDIVASLRAIPPLPAHCRAQPKEEDVLPPGPGTGPKLPEPEPPPPAPEPEPAPPETGPRPPEPSPAPPGVEPELPKPPVVEPEPLPAPPSLPAPPKSPDTGDAAPAPALSEVPENCCNTAAAEAQLVQCEKTKNEAWDHYSEVREQIARIRTSRTFASPEEEEAMLDPLEVEAAHWLEIAGNARDRCAELELCLVAAKMSAVCNLDVEFIVVGPPVHFSSGDTMACQLFDRRLPADCCNEEQVQARLEQCLAFADALGEKYSRTREHVDLGRSIGSVTPTDEEALACDLNMLEAEQGRCEQIRRCISEATTSPICIQSESESEESTPAENTAPVPDDGETSTVH